MSQQNFFPQTESDILKIQNKVILLYLIEKMDLPMTRNQIEKFALEEDLMNILTVQNYMAELEASGYLDKTVENDTSRFTLTEDGLLTIDLFLKEIPASIKTKVMDYVAANRKTIKQDFQANANYFYDHRHNEYIVKCAVYDDEMMLLEINISVATKDQAVEVCMNWRTNVDRLYGDVIGLLFSRDKLPKSPAVAPGCQDEMSASG